MPKRKRRNPVISGRDPATMLYRAVERYVKANHGSISVIGGISVIQFPGDPSFNFTIGVKCTGKLPQYAKGGE